MKHGITPKTILKSIQDILVRKKEEKREIENLNIELLKKYNEFFKEPDFSRLLQGL